MEGVKDLFVLAPWDLAKNYNLRFIGTGMNIEGGTIVRNGSIRGKYLDIEIARKLENAPVIDKPETLEFILKHSRTNNFIEYLNR